MRLPITFISFIVFSFSCADKRSRATQASLLDTVQVKKFETTTSIKSKPLITFYLHFDSSKTLIENLYSGWTDTFSIDSHQFRLKFDTTSKTYENCCIEELKNRQWQKLFNLYLSSDGYGKFDNNNDGYIDFVKFYHARHYTYFYNPVAKTITDTVCIMPEYKRILDKGRFILYNYYEAIYGSAYQSSQLYTYKQRRPYFFYEILLIANDSTDMEKMNLYKYKNGSQGDTIFIKTILQGRNLKFDYKKYWKKNYKELIGYSHL